MRVERKRTEVVARFVLRIAIVLIAGLLSAMSWAADPRPRSVLILSQWDPGLPWYAAVSSGFHSTLRTASSEPIAIYAEALDLSRFRDPQHLETFRRYLREKYREKNIGVIVPVGPWALEFMLSSRDELWPTVPLVFSTVDESTVAQMQLPSDVTGTTIQLTLRDMVTMAQVLVPKLQRFALVGETLEGTSIYRNFKQELPALTATLEFIDLTGLPMTEVKKRVAALPENTAILYTAIFIDGAGVAFDPTDALATIAEVANRPIVISTETQLGRGAAGGLILRPGLVGDDAARLTLRILNGDSATSIPIVIGNYGTPMFDWRQLTRWGVSETQLPPDSELRFRQPSLWDQYRWQILLAIAVVLLQGAMIAWLLFERQRRAFAGALAGKARVETGQYRESLAHLVRVHTVGEMSAAIAHEINQPLVAIKNYALAARRRLAGNAGGDARKVEELLDKIGGQASRAGDVLHALRAMMKKHESEATQVEVGQLVAETLKLVEMESRNADIRVEAAIAPGLPTVFVDGIQIQQVVLNLVRNAIEAVEEAGITSSVVKVEVVSTPENEIAVSVADRGPGIESADVDHIFDPFYSTKGAGLGVGLSISRAIVEAHGGRLSMTPNVGGGCVFKFTLAVANGGH